MQAQAGRLGIGLLFAVAWLLLLPACHGRLLRTQIARGPGPRSPFDAESPGRGILRRPALANEAKPYQHELKPQHFDEITKARALRAAAHQPAPNHLGWGNHWLDSERKTWDVGPNGLGKCTAPAVVRLDLIRLFQFLTKGK